MSIKDEILTAAAGTAATTATATTCAAFATPCTTRKFHFQIVRCSYPLRGQKISTTIDGSGLRFAEQSRFDKASLQGIGC